MSLDPKTLRSIVDAHIAKANKEHPIWDKWRAWYRSEFWGDAGQQTDDPLLIENNYLYAFCDTMVASVCPPNPKVTCLPRKRDDESRLASKYREALINDILYRIEGHKILWKMSTQASIYPRSILKAVWSFSKNRPDYVILDPRYFFFDMSVSRWEDIRYAIEVTTLTKAEFFARTKQKIKARGKKTFYDGGIAKKARFGSYPKWLKDSEDTSSTITEKVREVFEWVTVYEVYDFTNDRYYHMLEGQEDPLFAGDLPYVFVRNPFALLTFNDNMADIGGMSDSQLVERQQRRLNELDTLELRHAQSSIPITVINEALCDNPEDFTDQVSTSTSPGDVVRLQGKNASPLADILGQTPTSTLVPEFTDIRDRIEGSIQFVLGIPDYARGTAGTSEVATELALIDSAMRTRLGRRTKLVNSIIQHIAETTIGLYEEFMDSAQEIPTRTSGSGEAFVVARKHLIARNPRIAEELRALGQNIEEPLEIDYEVAPYSPTENSKSAQLKKMQAYMELLVTSPHVDQRRLVAHLLDVLDIGADVLISEAQLQEQQQNQAAAMQSGQAAGETMSMLPGQDIMATGGMPEGAPEVPVEAQGGMEGGAGFAAPLPGVA